MSDWNPGLPQGLGGPMVGMPPPPARPRMGSLGVRVAAAVVIAGGLAAGGYGIASAASNNARSPQSASQALATASSPSKSAPVSPRLGGPAGLGPFDVGGGFGLGRAFGQGGTVTQVMPTTITVDTLLGSSLTVTTDSSTVYNEGGKTVARSAVAVGEQVVFRQAVMSSASGTSGPLVVALVEIVQPHVLGKVVSINGSQLTVSQQDGLNVTVNTSTSTTYDEAGRSVPASDVQVGTVVSATGALSSDHDQIDATTIEIVLPSVAGRVTGVSGTTITITTFDGTVETVTTDPSTVFRNRSGTTTIASVAKGDLVEASGTPGVGSTFAAAIVSVGSAIPSSGGMFSGPGGSGGHEGFGGGPLPGGGSWRGGARGFAPVAGGVSVPT